MKYLLISFISLLMQGCVSQQSVGETMILPEADLAMMSSEAVNAYVEKNWALSYQKHQALLAVQEGDADFWFRFGVSAYRLGKQQEAERYFEHAVLADSRHRKALYNLTLINLTIGRKYLERYLQVTPPDQRQAVLEKTLHDLQTLGW